MVLVPQPEREDRDSLLSGPQGRLLDAMLPETLLRRYRFERYVPQHLAHEEALYRVCQEAVSNVIRHSGAREVSVEAHVDHRLVWLFVRDNCEGVDLVLLGSFISEHPAYSNWIRQSRAALVQFVSDGGVVLQLTQADQTESSPPFLPEGLRARR